MYAPDDYESDAKRINRSGHSGKQSPNEENITGGVKMSISNFLERQCLRHALEVNTLNFVFAKAHAAKALICFTTRQIIIGILFATTMQAHSLTIAGYKEQVDGLEAASNIEDKNSRRLMLTAYYAGITETLSLILKIQSKTIYSFGDAFVCLPESTKLNVDLIEAIMRRELTQSESYRNVFGSIWIEMPGSSLALYGLYRSYPCKK